MQNWGFYPVDPSGDVVPGRSPKCSDSHEMIQCCLNNIYVHKETALGGGCCVLVFFVWPSATHVSTLRDWLAGAKD